MSRIYEAEIRSNIYTYFSTNFNTMIDTLRTKYSDSTIPYAAHITIDELNYNYPEGTIEIIESENITEIFGTGTDDIDLTSEKYTVKVQFIIQTMLNNIGKYADYYLEAIKRVLHGSTISGITWIRFLRTDQQELLDENSQTYKSVAVEFDVQIN